MQHIVRPAVLALGFSLAACTARPAAPVAVANAPVGAAAGAASPSAPKDATPRSQTDYPTTDGEIALANLGSQIEGQAQVFRQTQNLEINATLANLLLLRGQITGTIADYERAQQLTDELVKKQPNDAVAWVAHGAVMSTFHRFTEALADYDRAEKLGYKTVELVAPRMGIAAALGEDDKALAYREKVARELPGIDTLGALATLKGNLGELAEASALFGKAQDSYRNISPFPVAMLYFQNGLLEQSAGSPARARALFQAAHDRLPAYAQATSHLAYVLAATGERDRAIELLKPLAESADDPEYAGQLAGMLRLAGQDGSALQRRAAERYEALVKKYPQAFSDHAARFWLSTGENAAKALSLAQLNFQSRPTAEAHRLVIEAALAARAPAVACKAADALLARPHATSLSRIAASKAYFACDRKAQGEEIVAQALKHP